MQKALLGVSGAGGGESDWIIVDEIGPLEMKRRLGTEEREREREKVI